MTALARSRLGAATASGADGVPESSLPRSSISLVLRGAASNLHGRGPINLIDGFCQRSVKCGIAHRMPEVFGQGSRKARDHAVIGGEAFASDGSRIAAGQRDNP